MSDFRAKPILCLDFDGVLHSYSSGWKGADVIPDAPVPGALEFIRAAQEHFHISIFSSRSGQQGGRLAMFQWLRKHASEKWGEREAFLVLIGVEFPHEKPPAFVSIDDRAICFEGLFPDPKALLGFKPWNKREAATGSMQGATGRNRSEINSDAASAAPRARVSPDAGRHSADCALHNAPAFEPKACDCGAAVAFESGTFEAFPDFSANPPYRPSYEPGHGLSTLKEDRSAA
jgi:hypothetical protein